MKIIDFANEKNVEFYLTSIEILQAIEDMARSEEEAHEICKDPSAKQVLEVYNKITKFGAIDPKGFKWHEDGVNWASDAEDGLLDGMF